LLKKLNKPLELEILSTHLRRGVLLEKRKRLKYIMSKVQIIKEKRKTTMTITATLIIFKHLPLLQPT
jgi:hypothetical protein